MTTPVHVLLQEDVKNPDFFKDKIRHYLLDNKHRMTLTMTPDVSLSTHHLASCV